MRAIILLTACIFLQTTSFSQTAQEDFRMGLPKQKIANSLFSKLTILDSRTDSTDMGFVLTGETNRKSKVFTSTSLPAQLTNVFNALKDQDAKDGELLLQLRRIQFYQLLGAGNEKGYCSIRMSLYAQNDRGYTLLKFNDTLLQVKAREARQLLFEKTADFMIHNIADHLSDTVSSDNEYLLNDIIAIDSIEKSNIPVYNVVNYKDGYYLSFSSFKNMIPDGPVAVDMRNEKVEVVKTTGSKGALTKILYNQDVYAIVYKGHPYISANYGFYPLQKKNDDFIFTGKASTLTSNSGTEVMNRLSFGFVGALLEPKQSAMYRIKLDHLTGQSIVLEEVKK